MTIPNHKVYSETISQNVASSKKVNEHVEEARKLIAEYGRESNLTEEELGKYWKQLFLVLGAIVGDNTRPTSSTKSEPFVMTDSEAKEFEQVKIQFGKHKGTAVSEIPLDYLEWLDDTNDFAINLRKYLKWNMKKI